MRGRTQVPVPMRALVVVVRAVFAEDCLEVSLVENHLTQRPEVALTWPDGSDPGDRQLGASADRLIAANGLPPSDET